eukprot:8622037-Pyramimonas_sp.AAC.1
MTALVAPALARAASTGPRAVAPAAVAYDRIMGDDMAAREPADPIRAPDQGRRLLLRGVLQAH